MKDRENGMIVNRMKIYSLEIISSTAEIIIHF